MSRRLLLCFCAFLPLIPSGATAEEPVGKVTMPLSDWEQMAAEIESQDDPSTPQVMIARMERRIQGVFEKGLFSGELVERFEAVDPGGHVRVPVLDGEVSLGEVLLDGERTSLLREGDMYTLGVDAPGVYEVRLKFFWGEDLSRFDRRLRFRLPEGGITGFSVVVAEQDIDAKISAGALTRIEHHGDGTLLQGNLDSSGDFDLSWTRLVTHRGDETVKMECAVTTLFTVGER